MLQSLRSWSILGACSLLAGLLLMAGCQSESSQSQHQQRARPSLPDGELAIENPWVEPAPAGSTSALYMTIANGRQQTDTLLRVRAPIIDSSVAYASPSAPTGPLAAIGALPIPAQKRLALKPGSTHVKLINLGQSLDEGSTPILNLEFAQSGLQRVRVPVRTAPPEEQ